MQNKTGFSTKFREVRKLVDLLARKACRKPESIMIVAVSKRQAYQKIVAAVKEGLVDIGENRVQEVVEKKPLVEQALIDNGIDPISLRWHMVGRLQSNKANLAARLFDVIQSVETIKVAKKLSQTAGNLDKTLDIMIEVNVSGEAAKGGISAEEAVDFAGEIIGLPAIRLTGLMTLGPLTDDTERIRRAFDDLRVLGEALKAHYPELSNKFELSMGMSGDYRIAIEAGATIVRIGTAIFGQRSPVEEVKSRVGNN